MNIEITEEERKYLVDTAVEKVLHGRSEGEKGLLSVIRSAAKKHVEKLLEERAAQAMQEAIAKGIEARVEAVLEAGFPTFDRYGNRTGSTDVKTAIIKAMEEKVGSSYDKPSETMVQRFIREKILGVFHKELEDSLKVAKDQIRAAVDGLMRAKLAETLRSALGLG